MSKRITPTRGKCIEVCILQVMLLLTYIRDDTRRDENVDSFVVEANLSNSKTKTEASTIWIHQFKKTPTIVKRGARSKKSVSLIFFEELQFWGGKSCVYWATKRCSRGVHSNLLFNETMNNCSSFLIEVVKKTYVLRLSSTSSTSSISLSSNS
jgi:hypothetical protein